MLPQITPQYFLTLFDEFSRLPSAKVEIYIGIASQRVSATAWGVNAQYAVALLTAHMIAAAGGKGGMGGAAGGALTSEQVGDLSRAYATIGQPGSGDQELLTTQYGAQFVALRRETIVTGMATGPATGLPVGWPCP